MSDVCKCINLSHSKFKPRTNERILIQSSLVVNLGELRLMLAEMLFEICKIDLFSLGEALNLIHDSTFHTLAVWALQRCHNNIYLVKYTDFFKVFCQRANVTTLINSFLKTNMISDFARFFMDNIYGASNTHEQRDTFLPFFLDILTAIKDIESTVPFVDPRGQTARSSAPSSKNR